MGSGQWREEGGGRWSGAERGRAGQRFEDFLLIFWMKYLQEINIRVTYVSVNLECFSHTYNVFNKYFNRVGGKFREREDACLRSYYTFDD